MLTSRSSELGGWGQRRGAAAILIPCFHLTLGAATRGRGGAGAGGARQVERHTVVRSGMALGDGRDVMCGVGKVG